MSANQDIGPICFKCSTPFDGAGFGLKCADCGFNFCCNCLDTDYQHANYGLCKECSESRKQEGVPQ